MTAIRQRWHRSAAVAGTGVAALVGAGILAAAPASAHTPVWAVDCASVTVNLTKYQAGGENTVSITAGDKSLLSSVKFGTDFSRKIELPKHSSPIEVRLVVKASDGDQFSRDETKTSPVCPGDESPSPSAPAPSPSESSSEAPAPSEKPSSAPKPEGGSDDLAETGSSSATPMIAGIAGVVLVAGAGMVVVARKRRSTEH
ncbi:MAG: LAETG motif-containing sortase-dependent surface protein [Streptomyces sp.]|uniref:LAETG motif-containing sortase-dependent surface protein n=1 Tax=Streptomyces sp. TaxID=1931 RepID=UPI003D6AE425